MSVLGFSGDFQIFTFYGNIPSFYGHIYDIEFKINAAWGWTILATNSIFIGLIIARIVYAFWNTVRVCQMLIFFYHRHVSNQFPSEQVPRVRNVHYATLIAAIVESGLVTWIGLLLYGITSVAPTGHITVSFAAFCTLLVNLIDFSRQTNMDAGFVMICIVPVFFVSRKCIPSTEATALPFCQGISQCLMIVRLSLSNTVPNYAAPSVVKNHGNGSKPEELDTVNPEVCAKHRVA